MNDLFGEIINMPDNFEKFWSLYPRKKEKKRAKMSFNRLTKNTQLECIEGVKMYIKQIEVQGTKPQFIKHPSTFINGENWEDEFDTTPQKQSLQPKDFKDDSFNASKIGYCTKCNKSDFYDKFSVHLDLSRCCGADLIPNKEIANERRSS